MNESVVELREIEPGIAQVTMRDRANKNTFSPELTAGLIDAFASIRRHANYKVVVVTGYDTYFASGGTLEALLAIYERRAKFTDFPYSLALDCELPVIAAMQGHGIGGGFILGMFADFVVLSRESVYTANFMKYGFTPGFGSTYILMKKLGIALAQELLMTAGNYRGIDLEKRGIPFPVLPRAQVLNHAYELARQVADKPRLSLVTLKQHLVSEIREQLPRFVEREVAMHEKTFHQPEVGDRIRSLFGK